MEAALGVAPSGQTLLLRKLILYGEVMQSHILHVYFLAAPDFFGVGSVIPLAETHREVVLRALRLKKLANDICRYVGGRHVHPLSYHVKTFTSLPTKEQLAELRRRLVEALPDLDATVDLLKTIEVPAFERQTEYVSLSHPDEYALYNGEIKFSEHGLTPVAQYRTRIREYVENHSTAKHARSEHGGSYMVGALARLNNNFSQLTARAQQAWQDLGLPVPCYNPFTNNHAQVVECLHCAEESIRLCEALLDLDLVLEDRHVTPRAGTGVGAAEVPRGTLFHEYTVNTDGFITDANLVIPTAQNLHNIEDDMRALVPQILDRPKEEITLTLEMLVRAYDPCISCATHFLQVDFVE
jgi:coenzyme F420-reducing hydrogenase alpha subunit